MIRCRLLLFALAGLAAAQSVPAGWRTVKDDSGACQFAVPPDWKASAIPHLLEDPKQTLTAMVVEEEYFRFQPLTAADIRNHSPARVVENSPRRIFLVGQPRTLLRVTTSAWNVWIPSARASCHLSLTLRTGADEALAGRVAGTLRVAGR
jgi:hypothetical protein